MRHWKRIEAFTKTYGKRTLVFGPFSMERRVVLLVGENGSGKTTLLKCLSGLTRTDLGFMRTRMAYCPGGTALPGNMKGRAYLEALAMMAGGGHEGRLKRLVSQFDLNVLLDLPIKDCSDGMRQRLALAGALLERGRTVLLDEPMRTLDARYRRRLVEWIAQSVTPFLIATHDLEAYQALETGLIGV